MRHTVTGAAVGLVSLIGYEEEIVVRPVVGRWIGNDPGVTGCLYSCLVLYVVLRIGLVAAIAVSRGALPRVRAEATSS